MSLDISLLPEFGWSIKDRPVYGPGSVFQGFVKINISEEQFQKADRLRIVFHATESTYCSGYASPTYRNQLFGSQKILWKKKDSPLMIAANTNVSLPFIIQLPMIQYPPSSNMIAEAAGLSYHSNFMLSVYLDPQNSTEPTIITSHKPITYMPFIETNLSKKPVSITTTAESSESIVSLATLDYVPGDSIPIRVTMNNMAHIESVSAKLFQVQTWHTIPTKGKTSRGDRKNKDLVAQNVLETDSCELNITLDIPADLTPTFTYSCVFSVIYQLQITVKTKGKLWSHHLDLVDVPITVGTLGYGIRSSEEIKVYSTFKSVFDQDSEGVSLPVPKFLNIVEYEESLPVYCQDKLPAYTPQQNMNCIM